VLSLSHRDGEKQSTFNRLKKYFVLCLLWNCKYFYWTVIFFYQSWPKDRSLSFA